MIVRAEMRMADEIDKGQAAGEIARAGGDRDSIPRDPGNRNVTLDELGVSSQRLSEWRETRDAGKELPEGDHPPGARGRPHTDHAIGIHSVFCR